MRIFIYLIIISLLLVSYGFLVEPNMLKETKLSISSSKLKGDSIKIALFSDTHFCKNYTPEHFDNIIAVSNEEKPDVIIFTGDFFDDMNKYTGDISIISEKLSQLTAPMGKFAIFGNHDYSGRSEFLYEKIMGNGGFTVLKNEIFNLPETNIAFAAIDDCLIGYGNPDIVADTNPDTYNIVLCHEPDVADQLIAKNYSFDLMLAGHTHGGQINIPFVNPLPPLGRIYEKGLFRLNETSSLFVTSGVGTTVFRARFACKPEICFLQLSPT